MNFHGCCCPAKLQRVSVHGQLAEPSTASSCYWAAKDAVIFTGDFNCGSNQDTIKDLSQVLKLDAPWWISRSAFVCIKIEGCG